MTADHGESTSVIDAGRENVRRSGAWTVPARLQVTTSTGNVRLDLRKATTVASVTEIDFHTTTGAFDLILPAGASADVSGMDTGTGAVHVKVPSSGGRSHIVLTGHSGTGSVRVAYGLRILGLF